MVQTTVVEIEGMSCGACVGHIRRAIHGLTGVVQVEVNLAAGRAEVQHLETWVGDAGLLAAIADSGYLGRLAAGAGYTQSHARRACCCA